MWNMAERPTGALGGQDGDEGESAEPIDPGLEVASVPDEETPDPDGWSAASSGVREWAAAGDREFGYESGDDDRTESTQ